MIYRQRKANRLKNYDYSSSGVYFVTICSKNRIEYFGTIVNKKMILNKIGGIVKECWEGIPKHFKDIILDKFVIMPNHVHGILIINNVENRHACSLQHVCSLRRQNQLLPNVINSFKSASSKLIHQLQLNSFQWQKSFYDHIMRNEKSLNKIKEYVGNNPLNWDNDKENYNKINTFFKTT